MNALVPLPIEASPVSYMSRAAIAHRITALLRERDAVHRALRIARARFNPPSKPPELTVVYRGSFGPIEVDVDPDWIRENLPDSSPRSRRGRRLRKLLRIHEGHHARLLAQRESSGVGPLIDEKKRIESELEATAKEVCGAAGHSAADVALQASALLAVELGSYYAWEAAPAVVEALLEAVTAREAGR